MERADTVIFAVWFDVLRDLVAQNTARLAGKVVIDPSHPIGPDGKGGFKRTLPDGVSSGSVIARMLPPRAHFVKAFGTVSAEHLANASNRSPERAVLFYATDDDAAGVRAERLISLAGFAAVKVGGLDQAIRIEAFGDLHDLGGLGGRLLTTERLSAGQVSTTSLPLTRLPSMSACAWTISSMWYTWPIGTAAVPRATLSRNSWSSRGGRSAASPP